jgi:hypothetical protein
MAMPKEKPFLRGKQRVLVFWKGSPNFEATKQKLRFWSGFCFRDFAEYVEDIDLLIQELYARRFHVYRDEDEIHCAVLRIKQRSLAEERMVKPVSGRGAPAAALIGLPLAAGAGRQLPTE